jgi:hypothetical protein
MSQMSFDDLVDLSVVGGNTNLCYKAFEQAMKMASTFKEYHEVLRHWLAQNTSTIDRRSLQSWALDNMVRTAKTLDDWCCVYSAATKYGSCQIARAAETKVKKMNTTIKDLCHLIRLHRLESGLRFYLLKRLKNMGKQP